MNVPNFDAMTIDELRAFWREFDSNRTTTARKIFPYGNKGYVRAVKDMANYAINKLTAMKCRQRGDIVNAQAYEDVCDKIYEGLPEYAKW